MLAIPLFEDDVAPRFCTAAEFLLVEIKDRKAGSSRKVCLAGEPWSERLGHLSQAGVSVLLCDGFNRSFLPRAEGLGIQVIWGLVGNASQLVEAYEKGSLDEHRLRPRRSRCRRRRKGKKHAR